MIPTKIVLSLESCDIGSPGCQVVTIMQTHRRILHAHPPVSPPEIEEGCSEGQVGARAFANDLGAPHIWLARATRSTKIQTAVKL